jgi:hypothetical protein
MNNNIRPSQRLDIFQSSFSLSADNLMMLQENLKPSKFLAIYYELKKEKNEIKNSNKPLDSFDKHNKFRRIYQEELHNNYDSIEGKSH